MRLALLAIPFLAAACATTKPIEPPPLEVPAFAADDERVETAGFVELAKAAEVTAGDRTFSLLAYAVGDELTLGAMVKGAFSGSVLWSVGARRLACELDTAAPAGEVSVLRTDTASAETLVGQSASFRGFGWVTLSVPRDWIATDGTTTRVQLQFVDAAGPISLPADADAFAARFVDR